MPIYLDKGRWGQEQIVPGPWVEASTRGHIKANPGDQYGYHWWVNNDGNYSVVGYKGQFIFVHRDQNMVVVFRDDLPGGTFFIPKLEDFGPKIYAGFLQDIGSYIQVIANNKITLKCGTSAYRTDIKWVWNNFYQIASLVVSAFKDNKCIYLVVHPMLNPEKFAEIVESLRFE